MSDAATERYRQTLSELADLVGNDGHTSLVRRWNRLVDQLQVDRRELEQSAEGRAAITGLLSDARPTVRLCAAAAALSWDEPAARPTMVELRDNPATYGLHSITAKHILLDLDAGRLDPDSAPPRR